MALDIRHALSASAPESLEALREMLGNLEAQLVSLYEEKEQSWQQAAPDEALTALYEDKQRLSARTIAELRSSVESLAAQLGEFYEAREHGHPEASSAPAGDHAALSETLGSLTEQLHALYDERATAAYGHLEAIEMVQSLEAQVASLLEERNDLAEQLDRAAHDVSSAKRRARELVNALVDQSFS
ncbi:hypothetical protein [Gemmatimonas phototrophica]|uniref:Uncharacterized protein n=1 Tax=Gemmatimonas phototrophica TaxID=1379270 RepID=A0A143BH84_9BACT|nr:hypothetical protein [Gemmatimonas phototrophica]AMW04407.1 hypothetical protein GEMMAAP_05250 [Gemmatimonas phototrophica]